MYLKIDKIIVCIINNKYHLSKENNETLKKNTDELEFS